MDHKQFLLLIANFHFVPVCRMQVCSNQTVLEDFMLRFSSCIANLWDDAAAKQSSSLMQTLVHGCPMDALPTRASYQTWIKCISFHFTYRLHNFSALFDFSERGSLSFLVHSSDA